jgi:hypothetical protein
MKKLIIFIIATSLFVGISANATDSTTIKITGIYSDMHRVKETGDTVGTELFIVGYGKEYYGFLQNAEGEPGMPSIVKLNIKGNSIEFTDETFSHLDHIYKFKGIITAKGIEGKWLERKKTAKETEVKWISDKDITKLKRGKSFWQ